LLENGKPPNERKIFINDTIAIYFVSDFIIQEKDIVQ